MSKYAIYNDTKHNFVKNDDHVTVATFETIDEAKPALYRIEELAQLNPNNADDKFFIVTLEQ